MFEMVKDIVKKGLTGLKKKKRIWGCVTALAVVAGLSMVFYGKGEQNRAAEVSVRSAVAEKGNISKTVTGTGTLENGEAQEVIVPVGVRVEKVLADSGDVVTKGQRLATLNEASVAEKLLEVKESLEETEDEIDDLSDDAEDSSTSEYLKAKVLEGRKEELERTQTRLEKLLKSKEITAVCDGVVSGVYVEADTEVSKTSGETKDSSGTGGNEGNITAGTVGQIDMGVMAVTQEVTKQSGRNSGILFLSADVSANADDSESADDGKTEDSSAGGGTGVSDSGNSGSTGSGGGNSGSSGDASGSARVKITSCSVDITPPATGAKPQTELGAADYFTGTISWNCSSESFQEETVYTATIKLTAKKGYEFSKNILPEVKGADVSSEVLESDSGESILRIKAQFSKTGKAQTGQQPKDGNQGQESGKTSGKTAQNSVSGGSPAKGNTSGSISASASGNSSASSTSAASEYGAYETAAFSIAAQDETVVSVNVDELDILSVKEGQTAEITIDALEGQSFEGKITDISQAVSGSGSTKYPVEVTVERTDGMRMGMSVSVTISIDEAKDAVLIPVSALQERGGKTFVYTESSGDGTLSGETEVTTGLSDGSRAEIVSGLSQGDTVYYLRTGSDDSDRTERMPGMNGMPGGGMPGGNMPDGSAEPGDRNRLKKGRNQGGTE